MPAARTFNASGRPMARAYQPAPPRHRATPVHQILMPAFPPAIRNATMTAANKGPERETGRRW